jgi:arginyl-tRNA--protein-N-Asp/Glu arginylyltransferase
MYLKWDEKTISDFSDENINQLYNQGYFFSRAGKGIVYQTRSLRIDLAKFKLSSENRRILKKNESVLLQTQTIPYPKYDWKIGKMGKDFYTAKFGDGTFSANKIKELLTDSEKSNFNRLLAYVIARSHNDEAISLQTERLLNYQKIASSVLGPSRNDTVGIGYAICLETNDLLHYCYPFYHLQIPDSEFKIPSNLGLGMMLKAILYAQEQNKKYVYLGSAQRPSDTYKLQFEGLEWFDGKEWKTDLEELKLILKT